MKKQPRLRAMASLAISLTALTLLAAEVPPAEDARLVDLNVVAVDGRGQPVTDLTSDDFQITENGKPQTIVYFHHNDSRLEQPRALGLNEFSNRQPGSAHHVTLILLDQLNLRFSTQAIVANQMARDLQSMESTDDLYMYLLRVDGTFHPVRGFDDEGDAQAAGVPWTRQIKSRLDQAMKAALRVRPAEEDVAIREQLTFAALDTVGAQLSRFPGRKNLVWVTDGIPLNLGPNRSDTGDYVDFTPLIRRLSEAYDRSNIAIYPVRQVMIGSPDAIDGRTGISSIASLEEFANMTGGRPDAGKDIGAAVRQAVTDVRTSYQIGYLVPMKSRDSKFHKVHVTTTRKGDRIQTKTGYYAWPDSPEDLEHAAINSVLAHPFDAGEIGLRGTVLTDPNNPSNKRVDVRIDAGDVALIRAGDQYSGQLRVVVADLAAEGRITQAQDFGVRLGYTPAERDQALRDGIDFHADIQGNPARLRVVVFDTASQSIGSVTMPVR